jgi:hypothetical protein
MEAEIFLLPAWTRIRSPFFQPKRCIQLAGTDTIRPVKSVELIFPLPSIQGSPFRIERKKGTSALLNKASSKHLQEEGANFRRSFL